LGGGVLLIRIACKAAAFQAITWFARVTVSSALA
jgi:hypothetical protein